MTAVISSLNKLAFAAAPIFWQLAYRSFIAVIIGVIWIGLCKIFGSLFTPNSKNILFYLLLIVLAGLPIKDSGLSVSKYIAPMQNISYRQEYDMYEYQLFLRQQEEQAVENGFTMSTPVLQDKVDELYAKSMIYDVALPLIWVGGTAVGGLWLALSAAYTHRRIKNGMPADSRINAIYQKQLNLISLDCKYPVIITDFVSTPATTGLLRKKILLPECARDMDDETIGYILLHELCHIKGRHLSIIYISLVLQTVYWFNPRIYLMFAHNRQNLELMADMEVLKYTDKRKEYARSIVSVLAHSRNTIPYGRILCMADSSENMRNRIDNIKNADFFKKHKTVIMSVSILLGAALTVIFYPVGFESGNIIDAKGAAAVEKQSSISIGGMNISCKLPWNWTSVNPAIYREEGQPVSDNPLPFGAFETITYLLQDDELIGYIGFSKFEPYTDEIPQEEYHKTVWPYLRLSSFQVWDPFVPVKQTDTGEIGIIDINYMDYDFYNENPGISMAAVPHCESFAIIGYNKEDGVYAAIAFLPDKADRETAAEIIQTMEITCSR